LISFTILGPKFGFGIFDFLGMYREIINSFGFGFWISTKGGIYLLNSPFSIIKL